MTIVYGLIIESLTVIISHFPVLLQVRQFIWVAVATGALGLLRALIHVASPLVIANYVTHEEFPGAYAVFMLAAGLVNVAFAPLIGKRHSGFDSITYYRYSCNTRRRATLFFQGTL